MSVLNDLLLMNNLVHAKFSQLTEASKSKLKKEFSEAPKMLRYLKLLERTSTKRIGVKEAVEHIYVGEKESFETLRNRFFKLRKKLLDHLETPVTSGDSGIELMPLEHQLYSCRLLVAHNKYQPAKDLLERLISTCWERNIFELLPDALHLLIYCNLALNAFQENERFNEELDKANELLFNLNKQRQLARMIYQMIVERKPIQDIRLLFEKFRKTSEKFKAYPRFTLYYHFIFASQGSAVFSDDLKGIRTSFQMVKQLSNEHPEMPVAFYEPYGQEMIQFYLSYGESMNAFNEGDAFVAYNKLMEAWAMMDRVPALRSKKTESNYSNKIAIEVATKRYKDALRTSEELLDFLIEQKKDDKKLKAYAEIIQIYTYAYPELKAPDPDFLLTKLDLYFATLPRDNHYLYYGTILMKAIFVFQQQDCHSALKIIETEGMDVFLEHLHLSYYTDIFRLISSSDIQHARELYIRLSVQLLNESRPEIVYPLQRAVSMLGSVPGVNGNE